MLALKHIRDMHAFDTVCEASLVRALLANVKLALECEHLEDEIVADFFFLLLRNIAEKSYTDVWRPDEICVRQFYKILHDTLRESFTDWSFRRRGEVHCDVDQRLVTIQSEQRFRSCMDDEPEKHKGELTGADIEVLCRNLKGENRIRAMARWKADCRMVWLAPLNNRIAAELASIAGLGGSEREAHPAATNLCELFGLAHKVPGEHQIWFESTESILHQFQGFRIGDPPPSRKKENPAIMAPTLFDAPWHTRFRHWPSRPDRENIGRTYQLNADDRQRHPNGDHGVPEMISRPNCTDCLSAPQYLGQYMRREQAAERIEAAKAYADALAGSLLTSELIDWLHARIYPILQ